MSSNDTKKNGETTPSPMVDLLGAQLLVKANKPTQSTNSLLKNKNLVAIYFSADWCPPCKEFAPLLKEFYSIVTKNNKNDLEIVYASSDNTAEDFREYYGTTMPWLAINMETNAETISQLAARLKIRGIPTVVVLNGQTCHFITNLGRNKIQDAMIYARDDAEKKTAALQVINDWKEADAVPIDEANLTATLSWRMLLNALLSVLKNPINLFAILYVSRILLKRFFPDYLEGAADEDERGVQQDQSEF